MISEDHGYCSSFCRGGKTMVLGISYHLPVLLSSFRSSHNQNNYLWNISAYVPAPELSLENLPLMMSWPPVVTFVGLGYKEPFDPSPVLLSEELFNEGMVAGHYGSFEMEISAPLFLY